MAVQLYCSSLFSHFVRLLSTVDLNVLISCVCVQSDEKVPLLKSKLSEASLGIRQKEPDNFFEKIKQKGLVLSHCNV